MLAESIIIIYLFLKCGLKTPNSRVCVCVYIQDIYTYGLETRSTCTINQNYSNISYTISFLVLLPPVKQVVHNALEINILQNNAVRCLWHSQLL